MACFSRYLDKVNFWLHPAAYSVFNRILAERKRREYLQEPWPHHVHDWAFDEHDHPINHRVRCAEEQRSSVFMEPVLDPISGHAYQPIHIQFLQPSSRLLPM